jgi:hypothetical protein
MTKVGGNPMKRSKFSECLIVATMGMISGGILSGCGDSPSVKLDAAIRFDVRKDVSSDTPNTSSDTATTSLDTRLDVQVADRPDAASQTETKPTDTLSSDTLLDAGAEAGDAPVLLPDTAIPDTIVIVPDTAVPDTFVTLPEVMAPDLPDATGTPDTADSAVNTDTSVSPAVLTGWPTELLNFGVNPCGGDAPEQKSFTLNNSGGTAAKIVSATFSTSMGYSSDASGKTIPAGSSLVVHVMASRIPQNSNVPMSYDDTLTITTDIPTDGPHLVQVSQSASGAILQWDTSPTTLFGSFGSIPPGKTITQILRAVNSGSVQARIDLITNGQFSVNPDNNVTIPAGTARDFTVTFTAPTVGRYAASTLAMNLDPGAALCEPLPAPLPLTGSSVSGPIAISTQSMVFYPVCGQTPDSQTFTITNTGTGALSWNASVSGGASSLFDIDPTSGTVGANTSRDVEVSVDAPTNSSSITSETIGVTGTGAPQKNIAVTRIPLGANITVIPHAELDFGQVPIVAQSPESASQVLTIVNNANMNSESAHITLTRSGGGSGYFATTPASVTVPTGGQVEVVVTFAPGGNTGIISGGASYRDLAAVLTWAIDQDDANCGVASGQINLKGRATKALVDVSPSSLDFGLVNCGTQASPQQITISNLGSAPYRITGLDISSAYTLVKPTLPATIVAGGSLVLTITPPAVPATVELVPNLSAYSGLLTITTDAIDDLPHAIPLTMGAKGAIITGNLSTTDWHFATAVPVGSVGSFQVGIVNTGNAAAEASLEINSTVFSLTNPTSILPNNVTTTLVARFQPVEPSTTSNASGTLTITPAANEVFCKPLPASWVTPTINLQGGSTALAN